MWHRLYAPYCEYVTFFRWCHLFADFVTNCEFMLLNSEVTFLLSISGLHIFGFMPIMPMLLVKGDFSVLGWCVT